MDSGGYILGSGYDSKKSSISLTSTNPLEQYRREMAFKNYMRLKYAKLIEFDKTKRTVGRIQSFIKKKVLYDVVNMCKEDIDLIPGIYRFRFHMPKLDDLDLINQMYDTQLNELVSIHDIQIRNVRKMEIEDERNSILSCMLQTATYVPVIVDIRIYGMDTSIPININGHMYSIPDVHREKITSLYNKLNEESTFGIRFRQMLSASKAIRTAYVN
jgi:hypothetical protein